MNWIIQLFIPKNLKKTFFASQEFLKGKKTYLAGAILTFQAIAMLIEQFVALNGLSDFVGWLRNITSNEAIQQFGLGLATMGIRAGISKIPQNKEKTKEERYDKEMLEDNS